MFDITYIFDWIGYLAPNTLFFSSIFFLYKKNVLLSLFIIGSILNLAINNILKGIIKQPRPDEDIQIFNASKMLNKRFGPDQYGMPSGHAQMVFFSTSFIFFALKNKYISLVYFIISLISMYQRVKYKNHTVSQVVGGAFVGSISGYLFYLAAMSKLSGPLKLKMDDNAPL
jgi:membrane-associated phospholipid phosphatase